MSLRTRPRASGTVLLVSLLAGSSAAQNAAADKSVLDRGADLARMVRADLAKAGALDLKGAAGLLVADGDSWFDYPGTHVLDALRRSYDYQVESVAHRGDRLEELAYNVDQVASFTLTLNKLKRSSKQPRAILVSAGGNDIAGEALLALLNHRMAGEKQPLNENVVTGLLDEQARSSMIFLLGRMTAASQQEFGGAPIPILIHGYSTPVPDGRGYKWLGIQFKGPWLEPWFVLKGYQDDGSDGNALRQRRDIMGDLIRRFNRILAGLPTVPGLEHVRYVNVAETLSAETQGAAYRKDWNDELHPTRSGFESVAAEFHRVLRELR